MKMVSSIKVLLLVVVGLIGLTSALCPKGFAAIKNNCFRVSHRKLEPSNNWNEAWRDCATRSGYLAEFSEHGKMQNLEDYLDTIDGSHYAYWIGGGDGIEQDDWRWVISGLPIGNQESNTKYCPGHPVPLDDDKNALVLDSSRNYCWQSINANSEYLGGKIIGYICEAKPINTYMID